MKMETSGQTSTSKTEQQQQSSTTSLAACSSNTCVKTNNIIWREIKSIFDATASMEHYLKPIINDQDNVMQWGEHAENSLLIRLRQFIVVDRLQYAEDDGSATTTKRMEMALINLFEQYGLTTFDKSNFTIDAKYNNYEQQHQVRRNRALPQQFWDIRLDGQSLLVYCIKDEGLYDIARVLLDYGANPNLCGKFFHTPLKAVFSQIEQTAKDLNDMQQILDRRQQLLLSSSSSVRNSLPNNMMYSLSINHNNSESLLLEHNDAVFHQRMQQFRQKLVNLEQLVRQLLDAGAELNYVHVADIQSDDDDTELLNPAATKTIRLILPTSYLSLAVQSCSRALITYMIACGNSETLQPRHQPHFVHPFQTALKRSRWDVAYEMIRFHALDPTIYDQNEIISIFQRVWAKAFLPPRATAAVARHANNNNAAVTMLYVFLCYYTLELAFKFPSSAQREVLRRELLDFFIRNSVAPRLFDTDGANLMVQRRVPSLKWLARRAFAAAAADSPRRKSGFSDSIYQNMIPSVREYLEYAEYDEILMQPLTSTMMPVKAKK